AALVMGASGIQAGTRFYASKECLAHIDAKNAIVAAGDMGTEITGYISNHSIRSLKNKATDKYIELEKANATSEELSKLRAGKARSAPVEGDVEWGLIQAGQSLSVITSIKSCQEVINDFIKEAEKAIENLTCLAP
ncbi:MAG: enoyl-[acyl-carrier-protein] reductase FabK, partial [Clostridiaceae bacterium]|nr:enoyl-[acyl-carrier-protein] reductase FabK [Clostridiaceae bacterium]